MEVPYVPTDFSDLLIKCSVIGSIMSEPKDKASKLNGELSQSCKTYLINHYCLRKYYRERKVLTKEMVKGNIVESDSIDLINVVFGTEYIKNKKRFTNEFIAGTPDIVLDDRIVDVKSCWDMITFLSNLGEPLDKQYYWQAQGYMALTGASDAIVAYCLVSTPQYMIEDEKRRLMYMMNVATEENEEYKIAAAELQFNMTFDEIEKRQRVLRYLIDRNDDDIQKVYEKVEKCRKYLTEFEEKHYAYTRQYQKQAIMMKNGL